MFIGGIIFNTFLIHLVCAIPEVYGYVFEEKYRLILQTLFYRWYERILGTRDSFDSVYNAWSFALFLVWFLTIAMQTFIQCFADKRQKNQEKAFEDFNRSPELESSFFNRLFLWWFNHVNFESVYSIYLCLF